MTGALTTVLGALVGPVFQGRVPEVFTYVAERPLTSVTLAGTFNNWDKGATPLRLGDDGRTWSVSLDLTPGRHLYKFVLDGTTWVTDPRAAESETDAQGNTNSVLTVNPAGYDAPAVLGDGRVTVQALDHRQEVPMLDFDHGRLSLALRLRPGDVKSVRLLCRWADGHAAVSVAARQRRLDTWTASAAATFPWDRKNALSYVFILDDGAGDWTYDSHGLVPPGSKGPSVPFRLDPRTFRPFSPPAWVERSVVYQVFPDRFANGDRANDPPGTAAWDAAPTWSTWFGGDLAGIRQHLGYLKDLGVTCVYFNPVFEARSNHRYDTVDFGRIDHRLGTNGEFASLTGQMSRLGIKTVLDGVFNHTSTDFFAFADILKNQRNSRYLDWYTVRSFPVEVKMPPAYEAWHGFAGLPKTNTANADFSRYLLSVPASWSRQATIAGWRLDAANEVAMPFWRAFRREVKARDPETWILGEIWGDGSPWLKGDQFDSVTSYPFRSAVLDFVANGKTTPTQFYDALSRTYESHGPQVGRNMLNLVSSHDVPRVLTECHGDARLARLAAMLQFTWVGVPCVYYGDELGMAGGGDPDNRRGMAWDRATASNPFLVLYRNLARLRQTVPALQSGEPALVATADGKGLLVFRRQLGDAWAIVAVNRSNRPRTVTVPTSAPTLVVDSFQNDVSRVGRSTRRAKPHGRASVAVSPFSVVVLRTPTAADAVTRLLPRAARAASRPPRTRGRASSLPSKASSGMGPGRSPDLALMTQAHRLPLRPAQVKP